MHILLLEDSPVISTLLTAQLATMGHTVEAVENGQQGFHKATFRHYDLVISDVVMPKWDGFKFMEAMLVIAPQCPIIVISSSLEEKMVRGRLSNFANVIGFLPKPVKPAKLEELLDRVKIHSNEKVRKLARIVCTLGPASESPDTLGRMVLAGMDIARLNFSHGTHEEHERRLLAVRAAEEEWSRPIAVLMDLCGPKIRTGPMENGAVKLASGSTVIIQAEAVQGTAQRFSTIVPEILDDLRTGDPILLDDGLIELAVEKEGKSEVVCRVVVGGMLKSSKGINLPATPLSLPSVTEKDKRDLSWGMEHSVDFVALSFVRSAREILEVKELISRGKRQIRVVAKIEKPEAVENIGEIIAVSDAIMIARGDLGVELPASRVPRIQREIIKRCWQANIPVITATQMLDSMTMNHRPTRAEVTDVSVAVRDGTDAVMLSGETAVGVDPVNVVRTMASIVNEEERYTEPVEEQCELLRAHKGFNPALVAAASLGDASVIMVLDLKGEIYRHLSKWNRSKPTLLVTNSVHVARHSCIYKNISPIIIRENLSRDQTVMRAQEEAMQKGFLAKGDVLAVVEGARQTQGGIPQTGAFQLIQVE
ncbi:MAG: pyruvate kinase [Desulfobulbaceae bacterium DB1]|nr:MAG: pyruvate kinase [Desulfobulbaceae bacterium DB1]